MKARPFQLGRDYPEICEWWRTHGFAMIPLAQLSSRGIVVEEGGNKYCAGWVYTTDSKLGWLEWVVTNPESPIKRRKAGLECLVTEALKLGTALGIENLFASVSNKNLIKLYLSQGFTQGDTGMTNLIARLI